MNNYIIIGDSITYGSGDYISNGWASMFKSYIINKDDTCASSNMVHIAAFPGATSTDIINKFDSIYNAFKSNDFNNIIILAIGINDTQESLRYQSGNMDLFENNIKKIISYVQYKQEKIVVLGLTNIMCDNNSIWTPDIMDLYESDLAAVKEYDVKLQEICKITKTKYIKLFDLLDKEDYFDGLHPNTKGHKKIFEFIKNEI